MVDFPWMQLYGNDDIPSSEIAPNCVISQGLPDFFDAAPQSAE